MRCWTEIKEDPRIIRQVIAGLAIILQDVEIVPAIKETHHLGGAERILQEPQVQNAMAVHMFKGLQTVILLLDHRLEHTATTGMADANVLVIDGRQTKPELINNARALNLGPGLVSNVTD